MKLYSEKENCYKLYHGSMLDMTEAIELNSIDSIVTDPPYELNFMNKGWDNSGIAFQSDTWKKCFDVLKPGGYLLAFGGSRTFHRIACAIEDAGFEIRDTIMWLYGSGFPKSMNIGLAIDKKNGIESPVVGQNPDILKKQAKDLREGHRVIADSFDAGAPERNNGFKTVSADIKQAQNVWSGWGTALKPSYEPIIVARKPVEGSITDNVLKNGVGGINIDECRVEAETNRRMCGITEKSGETSFILGAREETYTNKGRFPANTILTYDETDEEEVCGGMPYTKNSGAPLTMPDLRDVGRKSKEAIGVDKLSFGQVRNAKRKPYVYAGREYDNKDTSMFNGDKPQAPSNYNDEGSASRYFKNCEFTEKDNEETLLPQYESIIVARKPCEGSTTDNVLKYGVGGINIDECRVPLEDGYEFKQTTRHPRTNDVFTDETCGFKAETNTIASANPNGRFPANTILTYDETDEEEVCGGFPFRNNPNGSIKNPNLKSTVGDSGIYGHYDTVPLWEAYNYSGSASRYFMNCVYSDKDKELWKSLFVNSVGRNLEITQVIKENIAQMNVEDLLRELKDHYAKYVENQLDLIETPIVQDIVEILTWDFRIETSRVIQDFIGNSSKCTQLLNLVQFVESLDNIDTTQTTQNLLKLFGYVRVVITNYIVGNLKSEQKRYLYTPKASKKDRDEGCEELADGLLHRANGGGGLEDDPKFMPIMRKNTHPTVKPTSLMQYLVRLVTPNGGTVLDPFNGSGSTGKAVMYENRERNKGYKYIGIELTEEYLPISKARIEYAINSDISIISNNPDDDCGEVAETPKVIKKNKLW